MDPKLTQILVCPFCKGPLLYDKEKKETIFANAIKKRSQLSMKFPT